MDALDRNFGEFGWQISYKDVGGQIYGCLSILNPETGEWISKEDTGSESNIEAQKGQSSDILKRCAVRFGYGRELYTAPRIVIDDDGYGCTGYRVSKIEYNEDREIVFLSIVNRFGKNVFNWSIVDTYSKQPTPVQETISNKEILSQFCKSTYPTLDEKGKEVIKEFYTYWEKKVDNWKGKFDPKRLFENRLSQVTS